jgi:zinc D-Ala-D-Ala carboxypeptidase
MRSRKKISENVSYTEATKSDTAIKYGIDNTPNDWQLENMRAVAQAIFQPLRTRFRVPIAVTSFFRSEKLNKKIGGSSTSQHCKGEAMDIDADVFGMVSNREIFNYIKTHLDYDQLIWEFGNDYDPDWVHVSFKNEGVNRNQALRAYKEKRWDGKLVTKYRYI